MSEIEVKKATMEDKDHVLRMAKDFHGATKIGMPFDAGAVDALVNQVLSSEDHAVLVAENGGNHPIGMLALISHPSHFSPTVKIAQELVWWIDPDKRGDGAGRALLEAGEKWAKDIGANILHMVAMNDGSNVGKKYLESGYRLVESTYWKRLN